MWTNHAIKIPQMWTNHAIKCGQITQLNNIFMTLYCFCHIFRYI